MQGVNFFPINWKTKLKRIWQEKQVSRAMFSRRDIEQFIEQNASDTWQEKSLNARTEDLPFRRPKLKTLKIKKLIRHAAV